MHKYNTMNEAKKRLLSITRNNHGIENASPLKEENSKVQSKRSLFWDVRTYSLVGREYMFWQKVVNLDSKTSRPAAEPPQRPVQWVLGVNEADHVPLYRAEFKTWTGAHKVRASLCHGH